MQKSAIEDGALSCQPQQKIMAFFAHMLDLFFDERYYGNRWNLPIILANLIFKEKK